MAFEHLKINGSRPRGASPSKMGGGGVLGLLVNKKGNPSFANAKPMPLPTPGNGYSPNLPGRGNEGRFPLPGGQTNWKPPSGSGQTVPGKDVGNGVSALEAPADPAAKKPKKTKEDWKLFAAQMKQHIKNGAGFHSIMDWMTVGKIPGNGGWQKPAMLDPAGKSAPQNRKDKNPKPPVTPPAPAPQWTFTPSPFDQSPYAPGNPGPGPASQYSVNPPAQPWMFNPAAGGQGQQQAPQWYGQQAYPNSPPYQY